MATKKTKTRRREMSGERRIALALVEVIEECQRTRPTPPALAEACQKSLNLLASQGFAGLESINSRVAKIEEQLKAAYAALDGKRVQGTRGENWIAPVRGYHR
jgi:hypothetical protein